MGKSAVRRVKKVFLYGSLLSAPLRTTVLERETTGQAASVDDHRAYWVDGTSYPTIVTEQGATAAGELFSLSDTDLDRISFYEGGFSYDLCPVTLADGTEALFYQSSVDQDRGAPWSIADWDTVWGAISCFAAEEIMRFYGRLPATEIVKRFGPIYARAAARAQAVTQRDHLVRDPSDIDVIRRDEPYNEFFSVAEYHLRHRKFNGDMSAPVVRGVFLMADAVTVLPYDPVRDVVMLVEQFRVGMLARGDRAPWCIEPIAGRMDAGETPEQTAHREGFEEAGVKFRALHSVGGYYPSPGGISEYLYSYVGIADLPDDLAGVGGLAEEDEDIKSHIIPLDDLINMADTGDIVNGPLLISALWLQQKRTELRSVA